MKTKTYIPLMVVLAMSQCAVLAEVRGALEYGISDSTQLRYQLEYEGPRELFSAVCNISFRSASTNDSPLMSVSNEMFAVTLRLKEFRCRFDATNEDLQDKYTNAFTEMGEFEFQVLMNKAADIKATDLKEKLNLAIQADPERRGPVCRSVIWPMAANVIDMVFPILVPSAGGRVKMDCRDWNALDFPEMREYICGGSWDRLLSPTIQGNDILYWMDITHFEKSTAVGYDHDLTVRRTRRQLLRTRDSIFTSALYENETSGLEFERGTYRTLKVAFRIKLLESPSRASE